MSDLIPYDPDRLGERVYHLRKGGLSMVDIRAMIDPTPNYDDMVKAYRTYNTKLATSYGMDDRKQVLFMELDRLDALQSAVWGAAMLGDDKAQAAALNVMKHRAKIMGLDQLTADKQTVANILVVGGDKQAFVEALIYGRAQSDPMAGDHLDDGDDQEDA